MRSDWSRSKLGEIVEFNPRETISKGTIAKKITMDKLEPFCRDVSGYELEAFTGGTKFRNGDTIMARITPCLENGKTAKVSILDDGEVGFGSTEYIIFRAKEGVIDQDYLYYLVTSSLVRDPAIKSMVGSSGRQRVQTDVIQALDILLPPLDEQKEIASILRDLDDKIALNSAINCNLEQQAQAVFENIFNDCSDFCELNQAIHTTSGGTPSRKKDEYYKNGNIYWVKSKELSGSFIADTEEKITEMAIKNSSAKLLPKHSVIIAMYGATVGEYGIITKEMACNQAICALIPNNNYPYTYLFMFAKLNKQNLINLSVGSAQQNISQVLIKGLSVCSDIERIKSYHKLVSPLFKKIEALIEENQRLNAIRDTLLPKLMNGEIDVSKVQI